METPQRWHINYELKHIVTEPDGEVMQSEEVLAALASLEAKIKEAVELLTKTEPWVRFYSDDIMRGFQDRQTAKERTEEIRAFLQSQKGESHE